MNVCERDEDFLRTLPLMPLINVIKASDKVSGRLYQSLFVGFGLVQVTPGFFVRHRGYPPPRGILEGADLVSRLKTFTILGHLQKCLQ